MNRVKKIEQTNNNYNNEIMKYITYIYIYIYIYILWACDIELLTPKIRFK